jgi:hypothetical protein
MSVGHIGKSKGMAMEPTVSGGGGLSGRHGRGIELPAKLNAGSNNNRTNAAARIFFNLIIMFS